MGKNSKPILSVLVDEDKKDKFAVLARSTKHSMGWLLNDCIDRMLAADSIDIYGEPARSPQPPTDTNDIENLVTTCIEKLGIKNLIKVSVDEIKPDEVLRGDIEGLGEELKMMTERVNLLEKLLAIE